MLLEHILALLALAVSVVAMPQAPSVDHDIDPKIISGYSDPGTPPSLDHDSGPKIISGYSDQEREQIRQAHLDAIELVLTAINHASTAQYTNIYVKYFNLDDNRLVWDVLASMQDNTFNRDLGNRFFTSINVVDDNPEGVMMDTACDDGKTYAQLRDGEKENPSLIVCPRGFKHGSFDEKVWPGVTDVNCNSIGPRVSWRMLTLGHFFVQQYTHFQKVEGWALKALGGTTFNLANGPIDVLNIDRYKARANADSYAWFVTELAWTLHCGRSFDPPMAGDDDDPN